MLKAFLAFLVVWVAIVVGVKTFCQITNQEQIEIMKLLLYGFAAAIMSISFLTLIVFLF